MIFLGINISHNASAALMQDGKIIFALQEERFTNVKNFTGYPKQSIDYCIKYVKEKKMYIDVAGFSTVNQPIFPYKYPIVHFFNIEDYHNFYGKEFFAKKLLKQSISPYLNKLKKDPRNNKNLYLPYKKVKQKDYFNNYKLFRSMQKNLLLQQSKNLIKKIVYLYDV